MNNEEIKKQIFHGLIVSCQALEQEPLYTVQGGVMPLMAKAAMQGGAVGIRANSVRDIKQIKEVVDLPVIGIIKIFYPGFDSYITPTMKEVDELVEAKADIIAIDCSKNSRPNNYSAGEYIKLIKQKYPNQLLMADISDIDEAIMADEAGIDFIGTTLCGYVKGNVVTDGPSFELVEQIKAKCKAPIIAEGKIHYPEEAKKMLEIGAYSVVVGGAITRPKEITERFVKCIK